MKFFTPFILASIGLFLFFGYVFWFEFFGPNGSPHGIGVIIGLISLGLAMVLFGTDQLLIRRIRYGWVWLVEILLLTFGYLHFVS